MGFLRTADEAGRRRTQQLSRPPRPRRRRQEEAQQQQAGGRRRQQQHRLGLLARLAVVGRRRLLLLGPERRQPGALPLHLARWQRGGCSRLQRPREQRKKLLLFSRGGRPGGSLCPLSACAWARPAFRFRHCDETEMPPRKRTSDAPGAAGSGGKQGQGASILLTQALSVLVAVVGALTVLLPDAKEHLSELLLAQGAPAGAAKPTGELRKSGTLFTNATFWLGEGAGVTDQLVVGSDGTVIDRPAAFKLSKIAPLAIHPTNSASQRRETTLPRHRNEARHRCVDATSRRLSDGGPERVVDLAGAFVVPGFFDAHLHLISGGRARALHCNPSFPSSRLLSCALVRAVLRPRKPARFFFPENSLPFNPPRWLQP